MRTSEAPSSVSLHYADAHRIHYEQRDLLGALLAYHRIITSFPTTSEADHSRTQVQNIVSRVVPAEELLSVQTELALRHLQSEGEAPVAPSTNGSERPVVPTPDP